jgi:hypothetical protein
MADIEVRFLLCVFGPFSDSGAVFTTLHFLHNLLMCLSLENLFSLMKCNALAYRTNT